MGANSCSRVVWMTELGNYAFVQSPSLEEQELTLILQGGKAGSMTPPQPELNAMLRNHIQLIKKD